MKLLDRLMGRPDSESQEREKDKQALTELRSSFKRVGVRTDRLIDAYAKAEARRLRKE